jgi:Type II secretion system protein B
VSTILKALRKLEREKESQQAVSPLPVFSPPASAMGGLAAWFLKPWVRWSLVGFVIVALGGTAWHFYQKSQSYAPRSAGVSVAGNRHLPRRAAASRNQPPSSHNPAVAKAETARPGGSPHSDQQLASQQPAAHQAPPREIGTDAHRPPAVASPVSQPSRPAPVREEHGIQSPLPATVAPGPSSRDIQRPTPQSALDRKVPAASGERRNAEAASAGASRQTASASKPKAPSDTYKNTPLLTDGRLKVHAIAWSPKPAERMAVINSRVIYEGDSVDDFTILAIRPDDVVVREKGQGVWRVEFGRP